MMAREALELLRLRLRCDETLPAAVRHAMRKLEDLGATLGDLMLVASELVNNAVNQIVHTEDGSAVHSVMVGGRMVVEGRRVVGVDMASLARRVEDARARLEEISLPNKQLFEKVEHVVNSFCPELAKMPYHVNRFGGGHYGHEHAAYTH